MIRGALEKGDLCASFEPYHVIKKTSYTFLSLEKRPRHLQGCYTAQKMRAALLVSTHYDSFLKESIYK